MRGIHSCARPAWCPPFNGGGWTTPPSSALCFYGLTSSLQFTWKRAGERLRPCQAPSQEGGQDNSGCMCRGHQIHTCAMAPGCPPPQSSVPARTPRYRARPTAHEVLCSQARPLQRRASISSSSSQEVRGCQAGGVCETRRRPPRRPLLRLALDAWRQAALPGSTGDPDNEGM